MLGSSIEETKPLNERTDGGPHLLLVGVSGKPAYLVQRTHRSTHGYTAEAPTGQRIAKRATDLRRFVGKQPVDHSLFLHFVVCG
jgi:hypothetical protein